MSIVDSSDYDRPWPDNGLESLRRCPVCSAEERELIHDKLWDNVFFAAPGQWLLWRCLACRSGYLDPRPTPETIGLAYETYYTHEEGQTPPPASAFERFRAALANGYRNARYGTRRRPALKAGALLGRLVASLGTRIDIAFRYAPRPAKLPLRLLDVGCGNGAYLKLMQEAGWSVAGMEPDAYARQLAAADSIEVRETLSDWADGAGQFDFVTLNHVIEHVHDPRATLGQCFALLKPDGRLFVETPNIDAAGHTEFGANWRGLEPPRHLVLFNPESLKRVLTDAGFEQFQDERRPDPYAELRDLSLRMASGLDPYDPGPAIPVPARSARTSVQACGPRREFLTLTAMRPK